MCSLNSFTYIILNLVFQFLGFQGQFELELVVELHMSNNFQRQHLDYSLHSGTSSNVELGEHRQRVYLRTDHRIEYLLDIKL